MTLYVDNVLLFGCNSTVFIFRKNLQQMNSFYWSFLNVFIVVLSLQRSSWTWRMDSGRRSTSSLELWSFSCVSSQSHCFPSAASTSSSLPSVSAQLNLQHTLYTHYTHTVYTLYTHCIHTLQSLQNVTQILLKSVMESNSKVLTCGGLVELIGFYINIQTFSFTAKIYTGVYSCV